MLTDNKAKMETILSLLTQTVNIIIRYHL